MRRAHDLAQTADVRRERRDQDPTWRVSDQHLELFAYSRFRGRPAWLLDADAVAQHHQHAFIAEGAQPLVVGGLAFDRSRIELEVAGMKQDAGRRADHQPDRIGDAVVDRDRLDVERPELGVHAFADGVLDDAAEHAVLFELDRD